MPGKATESLNYRHPEIKHLYGDRVHLLANPLLLTYLAMLCAKGTEQPEINQLVERIYRNFLTIVVSQEFPCKHGSIPTRMIDLHPEAVCKGPIIDSDLDVVVVSLARAGIVPSQVCYDSLNYFMNPRRVRQDHISISRQTNAKHEVMGSDVSGHKIGGTIEGAIVLFPDPMGATGGTIEKAISEYRSLGKPRQWVALHCIVTPEYLKRVRKIPGLVVYALRLDRGLSPKDVLNQTPGAEWEREKGLNEKQYIVPGGGGLGEVMNNSFV